LAPASINAAIMAGAPVAGPRVATILVFLIEPNSSRKIRVPRRDEKLNPDGIETCASPEARHTFFTERDNFMADVANKYPENTGGKYYVDNQCIDCDLCRETAPDNFKRNDDGGYSFVYKQPESPEEEGRCKEAKEGCPVEAIGDNGG
jgi:ferredoxin